MQTLTYHVFCPIILWEIDITLLYMHGLEIIVVVLTMIHVHDNPLCEWCGVMENATHSFFRCIKYIGERQVFNDTVRDFQPLTINLILFGSESWNIETNMVLFRAIHGYIHTSKRFIFFIYLFISI